MADDDVLPLTRAERWQQRRRRHLRWLATLAGVAVAAGGVTVAAYALADDASSSEGDPAERALEVGRDLTDDERLPELSEFSADAAPRSLTYEDPLRVWVGGDSLSGAFGPVLGELLATTGVVRTEVDYKISSGLENQVRDWPEYAANAMAESDPEVVVFMIGANDASVVNSQDADGDGVPDWETQYRAKVAAMMDLLVGDATDPRTLVWVGSPTLRDSTLDRGAQELNRVMHEEADARRTNVQYVDAYRLFAGPDGEYTSTIVDHDGGTIRARIGDGVHLTPAGAEYLADAIFTLLDARFRVVEQTDPEHAIEYTVKHGGDGGGYDDDDDDDWSGSSGGSGSNRTTTTPPTEAPEVVTTAPPTTSAPTTVAPPTTVATPTTVAPAPPPDTPTTTAGDAAGSGSGTAASNLGS